MNKKLLITLLVGVMAMTVISAILVTYLSNTVKADVEWESPMELRISETGNEEDWHDAITFGKRYTGANKKITFYTKEENIADEPVIGYIENIVTSPGIKCADFESVSVSTNDGDELDALDFCVQDGYSRVKFNYPDQPLTWNAFQVDTNKIVVTFNNVIGKYTFTSKVVPTSVPIEGP